VVLLSSLADETPEGRSIVALAEERYGLAPRDLLAPSWSPLPLRPACRASNGRVAPSAKAPPTRCAVGRGAGWRGSRRPGRVVERIAITGGTPLTWPTGPESSSHPSEGHHKTGMVERFAEMAAQGSTIMITGRQSSHGQGHRR